MNKAAHKKIITSKYKRAVAVMIAIAVLLILGIGSTVAFLMTGTDPILNIFTPSKVTTEVVLESAENGTVTNVAIMNKDDTQAYIRAAVVVNWKKTDGTNTVYADAPVENEDYKIAFNTNDWIVKQTADTNEVIYYYKYPVDPQDLTSALFSNFALIEGKTAPEGYTLAVEVLGSGIQSTPTTVVEEEWGVNLSGTTIDSIKE